MFDGKHIIYRDCNDMGIKTEEPTDVKMHIKNNESFSWFGNPNQGDYITKNENYHLTSESFITRCSNIETMGNSCM